MTLRDIIHTAGQGVCVCVVCCAQWRHGWYLYARRPLRFLSLLLAFHAVHATASFSLKPATAGQKTVEVSIFIPPPQYIQKSRAETQLTTRHHQVWYIYNKNMYSPESDVDVTGGLWIDDPGRGPYVGFYFSRGQIDLRYYGEFGCRKSLWCTSEYSGNWDEVSRSLLYITNQILFTKQPLLYRFVICRHRAHIFVQSHSQYTFLPHLEYQ